MSDLSESLYAAKAQCQLIDTTKSTEFNKIWAACAAYACCAVAIIMAPYLLCCVRSASTILLPDDSKKEKVLTPRAGSKGSSALVRKISPDEDITVLPPDKAAAQAHLIDSSPTVNGHWRNACSMPLADMHEVGGVGTELYFRMLLMLGYCFCLMSICTLPILVFNWNGNFVPDTGSALGKTTIGNLGVAAQGGIAQASRLIIIKCQGQDIRKYTPIFGYLDVAAFLVLVVYMANYRFRTIPTAVKAASEDITVADFSIQVEGLPRKIADHQSYEKELKEHLKVQIVTARERVQRGGCCKRKKTLDLPDADVQELYLVRDFHKRLDRVKQRALLCKANKIAIYKSDQKAAAKTTKQLLKLEGKLKNELGREDELPVVRAYAILNTMVDARLLITHYRFANFTLFRSCQSRRKRFHASPLRITKAPEPSNILPEYADVSFTERVIRLVIMFILYVIAVIIAAAIIYAISAGQQTYSGNDDAANQELGDPTCDSGVIATGYRCLFQNASMWTAEYARVNTTGPARDCFCSTVGYKEVLGNEIYYGDLCKDWLLNNSSKMAIGVAASLVIIVLNLIFKSVITFFAYQERPVSVSALQSSLMLKMFGSQFLNTALIILIVNYRDPNVKIPLVSGGSYADFERGWYANVGGVIVTNMLINSISGSATALVFMYIGKIKRCFSAAKIKTQDELLDLYTNPPFDLSAQYASLLMTCYGTLMYSAAMPILPFFAAFYCGFTYWADKWRLLYGSQRPPAYDTSMPTQASEILLFAAPLHLIFAILMYSHPCVFPSDMMGGTVGAMQSKLVDASASYANVKNAKGISRLGHESTWLFTLCLAGFIAFVGIRIVLLIFGATVGEATKFLKSLCSRDSSKVAPDDHEPQNPNTPKKMRFKAWKNPFIQDLLRVNPPLSYRYDAHPSFEGIAKYMKVKTREGPADPEGGK